MATVTATLSLTLPIGTEKVSRAIINGNMQLIDNYAAATNAAIATLNGPYYLFSNDIQNETSDVTFKIITVPKRLAITVTKYGESPTITIKLGSTVIASFTPPQNDYAWAYEVKDVSGISAGNTLTISVTWSHSFNLNSGKYNLFAFY